MPGGSEAKEARRGSAEIDDNQEECRQPIDPEVRPDPRQAERQNELLAVRPAQEFDQREDQQRRADCQRSAVDEPPREGFPRHKTTGDGKPKKGGVAGQKQCLSAHLGSPQCRRTKSQLAGRPPQSSTNRPLLTERTVTEFSRELSDALQEPQKLAMHRLVATADRAGFEEIGFAVGAGHESTGLPDQQRPRGDVPGTEATLPKSI